MNEIEVLRVVVFREADAWLAQGLEHDVGVQGENLRDLIARFELLLTSPELEPAWRRLGPAPKYFQDLWTSRAGDYLPLASSANGPARHYGLVC